MTNIRKGRFTELANSLKSRLSRIKDTHIPTARAYGALGRAKGLRAVNIGALKVVDALEGVGAIRPRQAKKVRIGILSADAYDTTPYTKHTLQVAGTNQERQHFYSHSSGAKNPIFFDKMPKNVQDHFNAIARNGDEMSLKTIGLKQGVSPAGTDNGLSFELGGTKRLHDLWEKHYIKLRNSNPDARLPYNDNTLSRLQRKIDVMDVAQRKAIPKLRDNYTALRSASGKAALIAGLGGAGALLMANRRKNEQSGNSGRGNKSMAKRANTSNKYFR